MCLSYPALPVHQVSSAMVCRVAEVSNRRILPDIVRSRSDALMYVLKWPLRYQEDAASGT